MKLLKGEQCKPFRIQMKIEPSLLKINKKKNNLPFDLRQPVKLFLIN